MELIDETQIPELLNQKIQPCIYSPSLPKSLQFLDEMAELKYEIEKRKKLAKEAKGA